MPMVVNYNSARLNNVSSDGTIITLIEDAPPRLLLAAGIYIAKTPATLEIVSSVGTRNPGGIVGSVLLTLLVTVDGSLRGSTDVQMIEDVSQQVTLQTILTDLQVGHHVVRLLAEVGNNDLDLDGPVTMSLTVYA